MYNSNDILKMIQQGKTADEIAKEFTDALNKATKADAEAKAEKARKEEEARKAEASKREKIADMANVMAAVKLYIKKWYPNLVIDGLDITAEDVVELVDESIEEVRKSLSALGDLNKYFNSMSALNIPTTAMPSKETKIEKAFEDFFKKYNI